MTGIFAIMAVAVCELFAVLGSDNEPPEMEAVLVIVPKKLLLMSHVAV